MCVLSGHTHMHTDTHVLTHADLCRMMNSRRRGQVDSHKVMKWNDGPPGRVGKKKKKPLKKEGRFGLARKLKPLQANWVQVLLKGESTNQFGPCQAREDGCGREVCVGASVNCVCVWGGGGGVGGADDNSKQQTPSKETLEIFTTHARTYKHSQKKTPLAFPALEFNAASA